jgi:hypothetical protein
MRRLRPLPLLAVALAALAAACGGGSAGGGSPASSPGAQSPSSSAPSATSSTATSTTGSTASAGGGGDFCRAAARIGKQTNAELHRLAQGGGSRPAKTKATFKLLLSRYGEIVDMAPAEIKPSMQISLQAVEKLDRALARTGYAAVTPQVILSSGIATPRFRRAAARVRSWANAHCGSGD